MDSPLRPLAGTDPAPCPNCGGDLTCTMGKDEGGPWWHVWCEPCQWSRHGVNVFEPITLAGAPWTRALWAEVERLRRGDSVCVDDDGTPFASARFWRAANSEAVKRLGDAHRDVDRLTRELAELHELAETRQGEIRVLRERAAIHRDFESAVRRSAGITDGMSRPVVVQRIADMRAAMQAADEAEAQAAAKEPTP